MEDKPTVIAVQLVPHRAEWADMAKAETARLKKALGDNLVTVHHVGSTAIPGIMAKPIVDLLPVVRSIEKLDAQEGAMRALGYKWHGEFGLEGRRFCTFTDPRTGQRTFQLHCWVDGNQDTRNMLAFRDYLRAHPFIAKAYEMEKIRAAAAQPHDTTLYNVEKNDWIKRTQADAVAWKKGNGQ
ncbi:MAG TPA: GrpB family protein [Rhizomicrobium sp.]|nr:GrpB family protein [Rhizomicrobium sp.]